MPRLFTTIFALFCGTIVTVHTSCLIKQDARIKSLSSNNPSAIARAFDQLINDKDLQLTELFSLEAGYFCQHGMELIAQKPPSILEDLKINLLNSNDNNQKLKIIASFGVLSSIDEESINLIINEYWNGDLMIRRVVCKVIESINQYNDAYDSIILDALNSEDYRLVQSAAFTIAEIEEFDSEEIELKLIEVWNDNKFLAVKLPVAAALFNIGWEQDLMQNFILENTIKEEAFVPTGIKAISKLDGINQEQIYRNIILSNEYNSSIRKAAISRLIEYEPVDSMVNILIDCLEDDDWQIVTAAISELSFLGPKSLNAVSSLENLLDTSVHNITPGITDLAEDALFYIKSERSYYFRYWASYYELFI